MDTEGSVMAEERMLTVPQVADRLQVTEEVVRDWLRSGRLRGYRPGGTRLGWRVREGDLALFLEASANRPCEVCGEPFGPDGPDDGERITTWTTDGATHTYHQRCFRSRVAGANG